MKSYRVPFSYNKAFGLQSEINSVTITRVAGRELDFHRNVSTYHKEMMIKINHLCREQKRLREYRSKLIKKRHTLITPIPHKKSRLKEAQLQIPKATSQDQTVTILKDLKKSLPKRLPPLKSSSPITDPIERDQRRSRGIAFREDLLNPINLDIAKSKSDPFTDNIAGVSEERISSCTVHSGSYSTKSDVCKMVLESESNCSPEVVSLTRDTNDDTDRVLVSDGSNITTKLHRESFDRDITEKEKNVEDITLRKNLKTGLKYPGEYLISNNLIKLQYYSDPKLLCKLVDVMANRIMEGSGMTNTNKMKNDLGIVDDKDLSEFKSSAKRSDNFRTSKFERGLYKKPFGLIKNTSSESYNEIGKNKLSEFVHNKKGASVSFPNGYLMNREDMSARPILPPIRENEMGYGDVKKKNNARRFVEDAAFVDPILKKLSNYKPVRKVSWTSAFALLKTLKCL